MASKGPPLLLPPHWVMKESRSRPGYRYCFNQETGECRWGLPPSSTSLITPSTTEIDLQDIAKQAQKAVDTLANSMKDSKDQDTIPSDIGDSRTKENTKMSILKNSGEGRKSSLEKTPPTNSTTTSHSSSRKRSRQEEASSSAKGSSSKKSAKEVRVLHILKKHKDSRRPASWRRPKITDTKEKAIFDLKELIDILKEVQGDPKELRATFEELAKTESDCSSAKRGGDLGFFGPKKMQPAFEKAAFSLGIGELSKIVETSSGVHVLLRIG